MTRLADALALSLIAALGAALALAEYDRSTTFHHERMTVTFPERTTPTLALEPTPTRLDAGE